jgi:hypothetical protein
VQLRTKASYSNKAGKRERRRKSRKKVETQYKIGKEERKK